MGQTIKHVEKWGIYEIKVLGYADGNPFTDYEIQGHFKHQCEEKTVDGFYDGSGTYVVRFMPSFTGKYTYKIAGTFADACYEGSFEATLPDKHNHGPVHVANTCHFAYEDGTPYYSIGTTCYAWTHQSDAMQQQTLKTLKSSPFNKIRFCVFPKHYDFNLNEPVSYPYEGKPCDSSALTSENFHQYNGRASGNDWDFYRFNPVHFRQLEKRIADLMNLGIEADLIIMHPYDRWGFSEMPADADDLYWKYVIARFSAYRNVWWSLANEYDLMSKKTLADWERYAGILCQHDPYQRLRSIHNCLPFYDYNRPWITHCSIQRQDTYKTAELTDYWREKYQKPVVLDEIVYEGNVQHGWGNISGKELVRRFWEATCRGGYAGHGETYLGYGNVLWWSHGGELHGDSSPRFAFLAQFLADSPAIGLKTLHVNWDDVVAVEDTVKFDGDYDYYLFYYGVNRPSFREFKMPGSDQYHVEVIDTWHMTIEDKGLHQGKFKIDLPGREYMAVRMKKAE